MKKFLLYGYGGAYNHGAEAIVRTTVPLLRQLGGPILLSTHFPEQDREFGVDKLVDKLIPADLSLVPQERAAATLDERESWARQIYHDALSEIDENTVCIGIGGDNYCYPNWHRQAIFHKAANTRGATSILWGCSIQPESIDCRMEQMLRQHDHIYTRESETYRALLTHGITHLSLQSDPAFTLPAQPVPLPEGFCPGRTAAINLSPLVLRRQDGLMAHFLQTAHQLLQHTQALLLLPHVTMPSDNDQAALTALMEQLTPEEQLRVCRPNTPLNAAQLKYLIAQCELLVCTRTHASIAGYSSGVPTLVVGYSVKSLGIARDLHMENWVLPLEESQALTEKVKCLWQNRQAIRNILTAQNQQRGDGFPQLSLSISPSVLYPN